MTTPTPETARAAVARRRLLLEVTGLLMLLGGVAGVTVAGFAWDWRVGLVVVSVIAMTAGFALSSRKV